MTRIIFIRRNTGVISDPFQHAFGVSKIKCKVTMDTKFAQRTQREMRCGLRGPDNYRDSWFL